MVGMKKPNPSWEIQWIPHERTHFQLFITVAFDMAKTTEWIHENTSWTMQNAFEQSLHFCQFCQSMSEHPAWRLGMLRRTPHVLCLALDQKTKGKKQYSKQELDGSSSNFSRHSSTDSGKSHGKPCSDLVNLYFFAWKDFFEDFFWKDQHMLRWNFCVAWLVERPHSWKHAVVFDSHTECENKVSLKPFLFPADRLVLRALALLLLLFGETPSHSPNIKHRTHRTFTFFFSGMPSIPFWVLSFASFI